MTEWRISFLLLPIILIYGLPLLRLLAYYFARVLGDEREEEQVGLSRQYRRIIPPSNELAIASVALDLADIVGKWSVFIHNFFFTTGVQASLILPIVLLIFHAQLYILAVVTEQRLTKAAFGSPRYRHTQLLSMGLGVTAAMTNAVTISALFSPGGF